MKNEPRIYVTDLAAYNSGILRGVWIDCEGKTAADLHAETQEMLKGSPYPPREEWAIHDYEGFGSLRMEEYTSFDTVAALAAGMTGENPRGFAWLVGDFGMTPEEALEQAESVNIFEGDPADYAAEFYEEAYAEQLENLPGIVRYTIDWDLVAHDLILGGNILKAEDADGPFLVTNPLDF